MFQDLQLLYGSDISTHITHWIYKWKLVPSVDVWRVKYFPLHNLMFTLVVNIRGNCNPLFYSIFFYMFFSPHNISWQLRRSRVSVLASGTSVRGFKPSEKILSTPSFGGEVKLLVPCCTLQHVKDPKMAWKSSFRLNLLDNILTHSSTLRY